MLRSRSEEDILTLLPGLLVAGVPELRLFLAQNKLPFPKQSPETVPLSQGQPRGDMMPVGALVSDPALNSQMCQPVCLDFTSILWSYGEGVRDNGHVCRAQVFHEGFQTKGYRGSRIPKSSAYPVRKRK